jgi:hypothetical protein
VWGSAIIRRCFFKKKKKKIKKKNEKQRTKELRETNNENGGMSVDTVDARARTTNTFEPAPRLCGSAALRLCGSA